MQDMSPLLVGDTEKFTVTSNYVGQVQYKESPSMVSSGVHYQLSMALQLMVKHHLFYQKQMDLNSVNTNFQFG